MIVRTNVLLRGRERPRPGLSTLHTMSCSPTFRRRPARRDVCLRRRGNTPSGLRPIYRERRTSSVEILSPCLIQDGTGTTSASCTPATASGSTGSPIPLTSIVSVLQLRDGVLEIDTDLHRRRNCCRLRGPRGLQRQPGGSFSWSNHPLRLPAATVWVNPPPAASRQLVDLVPFPALKLRCGRPWRCRTRQWDSLIGGRGHVNTSRPTPSPWPQRP